MPKFNLELSIFNFACIHSKRRKLGMFILYKKSQFINPNKGNSPPTMHLYPPIPFKLARLLVTHNDGKLTQVGELSIAEPLQGRWGNPLARVTLALGYGYPCVRKTLPAWKHVM